jgi:DNA repair exonuclease SbcCD ATPase subunit
MSTDSTMVVSIKFIADTGDATKANNELIESLKSIAESIRGTANRAASASTAAVSGAKEATSAYKQTAEEVKKQGGLLSGIREKIAEVNKSLKEFGESIANKIKSLKDLALGFNALKEAASTFLDPLAEALEKVIDQGIEFSAQMQKIMTISFRGLDTLKAGPGMEATKDMKIDLDSFKLQMSDFYRELAVSRGRNADIVAEAGENLARAGFNAVENMKILPSLMDLTTASGAQLGQVSEVVANNMRALGYAASEAGKLTDMFAKTTFISNTKIHDLEDSLKYIAPVWRSAGHSTHELLGSLALLADLGTKGSQAGTSLRQALLRLAIEPKRTEQGMKALGVSIEELGAKDMEHLKHQLSDAAAAMKEIGVETETLGKDGKRQVKPFIDLMEEMEEKLSKMGTGYDKIGLIGRIFGTEPSSAMLDLIVNAKKVTTTDKQTGKSTTSSTLRSMIEQIDVAQKEHTSKNTALMMSDTLEGDLRRFKAASMDMGLTFYYAVEKMFRQITQTATSTVKGILVFLKTAGSGIADAFYPLIVAVQEAFGPLMDSLGDFFHKTPGKATMAFGSATEAAKFFGQVVGQLATLVLTPLIEGFKLVSVVLTPTVTAFVGVGKAIGETVGEVSMRFGQLTEAGSKLSGFSAFLQATRDSVGGFRDALNQSWAGLGDVLAAPFEFFTSGFEAGIISGLSNLGGAISDIVFGIITMALSPLKLAIPADWVDGAISGLNTLKSSLEPITPLLGGLAVAAGLAFLPLLNPLPVILAGMQGLKAWITSINASLTATSVSAGLASGALTKLQVAANLAGAAFAGWSVGTYLWNQFELVRVAGYEAVSVFLEGFENLKYATQVFTVSAAIYFSELRDSYSGVMTDIFSVSTVLLGNLNKGWLYMSSSFASVMQTMQGVWQSFVAYLYEKLASIVDKLAGLTGSVDFLPGMGDMSSKLQGFSMSLGIAATQAKAATLATVDYNEEYKKQVQSIDSAVESQLESIAASTKAGAANEQLAKSLATAADERERNIKLIKESRAELVKEAASPVTPQRPKAITYGSELDVYQHLPHHTESEGDINAKQLIADQKAKDMAAKKAVADARKEALREEKNEYRDHAKELTDIAQKQAESIKDAAKSQSDFIKQSAESQVESLKSLSERMKQAAKEAKEVADKLKKDYDELTKLRSELGASGLSEREKTVYAAHTSEQGTNYGAVIAQSKMLTSANQELTKAKEELTKATLSETDAKLFDLQLKYPDAIAAEIFQMQELAKQKKASVDLNKQLEGASLSSKQNEYVELMRKVGVEEASRYVRQKQLIDQQTELKSKAESYWSMASDKAAEYFEKFRSGQLSAKESLKGFFSDMAKEQQKAAMDTAKKQFLGLFGLDSGANKEAQVQKDLNKAASFLADSNKSVVNASKDASGTIAKAIVDAGERLSGVVSRLGTDVSKAFSDTKSLEVGADMISKHAESLKSAADKQAEAIRESADKQAEAIRDAAREQADALKQEARDVGHKGAPETTHTSGATSEVAKSSKELVSANQKYVKVTDEVASALEGAAKKFNYSLLELSRMASLESAFDANIKNFSGYMGLFQFKGAASKEVGISGKEYDPKAAAEGAIKYWEINKKILDKFSKDWRETAEKMNINEGLMAWMAHNQGAGGLSQVLKTLTTGVNQLSSDVTRNIKNNLVGGAGKELSGVALAERYMEGWIAKWNNLPLPSQFKDDFQSEVGKGVIELTAKASEESSKVVAKTMSSSPVDKGTILEDSTLDVLSETTNKYIQKGVSYELGAKNIELGKIDCSGWVNLLTKTAFENINKQTGQVVFDNSDMKLLQNSSHNIIQSIVDKTGVLLDSRKTSNFKGQLKEGMMIGLDKGDHGWDSGRVRAGSDVDRNIDHIVQVTVDKLSGKLGISESRSVRQNGEQRGGVTWTELDKWLSQNKKATMFATEPFKLAAKDIQKAFSEVSVAAKSQVGAIASQKQATAASTEAAKAQVTAQQELAEVEATLSATKLSTAASHEQAMAAVEAARRTSMTQDATAIAEHASSTQVAGKGIVLVAEQATNEVASVAQQAKEGVAQATTRCISESTTSEGGGVSKNTFGGILNFFKGGDDKGGGGFLSSITKGLSSFFKGGKEGGDKPSGVLSSIGTFLSGEGNLTGKLQKSLGGLLGGKGMSELTSSLSSLTGSMGSFGKGISTLLGGGSTPGMSALSSVTSLLAGDMAGAASGAAQLLGSMTPLGPLGGMIAGQLTSMLGIGAKWVREAEWVEVSMKGMSASFGKGYKEVKKGLLGGSKMGHESLDDASVKKLSDMLGETKKSIEAVSASLGMDKNGLLGKMENFRYHIAAMENKGSEWFDKAFEKMRVMMVKSAVDNIMIAGEDIKTNLGGGFKNTFKQVLDGTFNEVARAETWDGVLTKFVASADSAVKGGLQDDVSGKLGERLTDFVNASAEQIKTMPVDELQNVLTGEIGKIFTDITGVAIPESITGELASVFATRVQDAVKLAAGEDVAGKTVIKDTGEVNFYKTLKSMVASFEGTEQELSAFVGKMMETKDIFKQTGLSMGVFSESMVTSFGDMDRFSASLGFFKENFATVSTTNIEFANSLATLNASLKQVQLQALPGVNTAFPKTREEFFKLAQSVSELGKDGEATFSTLLKGGPQFASYYKAIEEFNQKFGSATGNSLKVQAKNTSELTQLLNDSFKNLGLEVPKTRKELFELVQGFDLTNNSQRKLHDSILELAPALDGLYINSEQVDKFRESMQSIYDTSGTTEKTLVNLSKEFPNLSLGAGVLTLNAKEAARQLASMSTSELMTWAENMGMVGLSIETITQKTSEYLGAVAELQDKMFSNINADSLGGDLMKVLTDANVGSAAEAGRMFAANFTNQFYNQLVGTVLNGVMQTVYEGIVSPFLSSSAQAALNMTEGGAMAGANLAQGGNISASSTAAGGSMAGTAMASGGMLAGDALAKIVSEAVDKVKMMGQIMNDPAMKEALNTLTGGLQTVGEAAFNATPQLRSEVRTDVSQSSSPTSQTGYEDSSRRTIEPDVSRDESREILKEVNEDVKNSREELVKLMSDFTKSLSELSSGLEGNAKVLAELRTTYRDTTSTQLLASSSSADMIQQLKALSQNQLEDMAAAAGVEVSKLTSDLLGLVDMTKQSEKTMSEFREKMGEIAGTEPKSKKLSELHDKTIGALSESSISKLREKLSAQQTEVSSLASKQKSVKSDAEKSIVELVESSRESSFLYLKSLKKQQGGKLSSKSQRELEEYNHEAYATRVAQLDSLNKATQASITTLTAEIAVKEAGIAATKVSISTLESVAATFADTSATSAELATSLASMDDSTLKTLADSLGVTVEQFTSNTEEYINLLKAREESVKSVRDSLQEFASPEKTGKQQVLNELGSVFADLGLAAKAMTLDTKEAAKAMLSMPDEKLIAFAEQYSLTTDQLKEKTTAYFGAVNELQQGMDTWRGKMEQLVTSESDASLSTKNLAQKSPYLSELTQGMDSKAMAKMFSGLDSAKLEQLAAKYGVSLEKFEADTELWVSSTKAIEEDTKAAAQSFIGFRDSLLLTSGSLTENEITLRNLATKYPMLSSTINDFSLTAKEAAERFNALSDDELKALASSLKVDLDTLKTDAGTWLGVVKSQDEMLKENTKSIKDFQASMRKTAEVASESSITLEELTAKYPELSLTINNSSQTAKEAASRFASMDIDSLMSQLSVSPEKRSEFLADAQAWVGALAANDEAIKTNKEAMSSYTDTMLKATGTYGENDIALKNLTAAYPLMASTINDSSITAKNAATYFASLSDTEFDLLAKSLNKSTEELRTNSTEWVTAMAANEELFNTFHGKMLKLKEGMSDNAAVLEELKAKYPALAVSLSKTGVTAQEVSNYFESMNMQQVSDLAKSLHVSTETLVADVDSYIGVLSAQTEELKAQTEKLSSFKEEMSKFGITASEAELATSKLSEQFPELLVSMQSLGGNSKEVAAKLAKLDDKQLLSMATASKVSTDKFLESATSYVTSLAAQEEETKAAISSVQGMQAEFKKLASGVSDAQYTVDNLTAKYPHLLQSMGLTGKSADDVAKKLAGMSPEKLVNIAKGLGVSTDTFVGEITGYVSALKTLGDEAKAMTDSLNSFKGEMDKLGSSLTDNEYTLNSVTKSFPQLTANLSSLGSTSQSIAKSLAGMSTGQLSAMAKQAGVSVDEFTSNSKAYIDAMKVREESIKQSQEQALQDAKENQDKLMQTIDNYFTTFTQLSDKLAGVSNNLAKDISAYDTEEQKLEKRRNRMSELESSINSLNSFGLDNEKAVSKTIEDLDEYRGLILEETEQKIELVKKEQEAAQKAHDDTIAALKESLSKVQGVISSVSSDIERLNEELKQGQSKTTARDTLKTTFTKSLTDSTKTTNERIDLASQYREAIGNALQEQLTALDKSRDEAIANLEKERDAKIKHFEEVQDAAKKLQESVTKLRESISSMRQSIQADMENLAKDMGLPGTTATEKLMALQNQVSANMPASEDSIKKLETYKALVMESLAEQIDKENKRFEEVKKTQDAQREHYKKLIDFSKELKGFVDNLKLGDMSYYNPQRRLEEAKRQYTQVLALAKSGDEQAMSEVTGKAQAYLKEAQTFYASSDDYTKIFDDINASMEGMKLTAESEAKKIAQNLPLDETETAKNIASIVPLQQAAMEKLKSVDALLASMDTTLQNPSASPMPDEQFNSMLDSEKQNFDKLIEAQKQSSVDTGNKLREAAKSELQTLNSSLLNLQTGLEESSSAKFDDTVFANQITGLQQASVQQLMELGQYIIAMDAGVKDSLSQNVGALMSQLSPENQEKVAVQLDEAMQRNITGPLRELIAAVKGEKVNSEIKSKEKGFSNNQTAIDNALTAFASFREFATKNSLNASFEEVVDKLIPYINNTSTNMEGIANVMREQFKVTSTEGLGSVINQVLKDRKDTAWESFWPNFRDGYLQTNKELLTAFQAKQDDKKAIDLATYRELNLAITGLTTGLSQLGSATVNKGRTEAELYGAIDKRPTQEWMTAKGVGVNIETYEGFLKAKETLDALKKSLLGITSLKGELDGFNVKLADTKTSFQAIPKLDIATNIAATVPVKTASIHDYVAQLSPLSASTTNPTAKPASTGITIGGNVSTSGAKDIVVKLDDLFVQWKDLAKTYRDEDIKNSEKLDKEAMERTLKWRDEEAKANLAATELKTQRWLAWRTEEALWRKEDVATLASRDTTALAWREEDKSTLLAWRVEDIAFQQLKEESEKLWFENMLTAIKSIQVTVTLPTSALPTSEDRSDSVAGLEKNKPSFDVGSSYVEKDMAAKVHKGEIIIDSQSAGILRNYGIRLQTRSEQEEKATTTASSKRVEELLAALLVELKISNRNSDTREARIVEAVNNMENTIAAPVVSAIKKGQQPTIMRK